MKSPPGFTDLARGSDIRIIDMQDPDWREKLLGSIDPAFKESPDELVFKAVLDVARDQLGARSAVIEPYTSTDWHDEYGRIYSRVFLPIQRQATRIHFFGPIGSRGAALRHSRLFHLSDAAKRAYLGYTVLRPLPAFRVGDTVLASPCLVDAVEGGLRYDKVHCLSEFKVSLLGNELSVIGMPFIQQETAVGVCAVADLWMVARYFNRLREGRRYRPGEINDLAMKNLLVGHPSQGLFEHQVIDAMRQMGFNPYRFYSHNPDEVKEFIFTCVESELPVIVGVPEHVMVVIGHDCAEKIDLQSHTNGVGTMSDCVDSFIVHDDASGPYRVKAANKLQEWTLVFDEDDGAAKSEQIDLFALDEDVVYFCLVCMPHRVNLFWDELHNHATTWLRSAGDWIAAEFEIERDALWHDEDLDEIVFRVYLQRSDKFKAGILTGGERTRDPQIIARYRCMPMPRYIWVVEMARRSNLQGKRIYERLIEGEMIFDATASSHLPDESLLAFHLDGLLYIPRWQSRSTLVVRPDEEPYSPLLRFQATSS